MVFCASGMFAIFPVEETHRVTASAQHPDGVATHDTRFLVQKNNMARRVQERTLPGVSLV